MQDTAMIKQLRQKLLDELSDITEVETTSRAAAATVELDQTRMGRLSRMDALQGQAMAQVTNARRRARAQEIHAALARIERGDYGECMVCGDAIAVPRLRVNPAVSMCIGCAETAADD